MRTLRIATRQSALALWQAEYVSSQLEQSGRVTELVPLLSSGDTDMRPIQVGRQLGVFTKRIQQALLDDEADVAVHSLKDLPTEANASLKLAAVPAREDVRDALISPPRYTLESLPQHARIGTGSRRRAAQLLHVRPDLQIEPLRGNVQTRLATLSEGKFDAIVLAEAGLHRLELNEVPRVVLSLHEMLPAPGQGALGIEVRSGDRHADECVSALIEPFSFAAVTAERTLLAELHGGCLAPIATYASIDDGQLQLTARVLSADGAIQLHERASVPVDLENWRGIAVELGKRVSQTLAEQGAREMIEAQR